MLERDVDERQRDVDHPLEIVDRDPLVRRVDVLHAVGEVETPQPALVEHVRVGGAPAQPVARREPAALEGCVGDPHDVVVPFEAVALVALVHLGLDLAVLEAGRERDRVEHLLHDVRELAFVVRASLREKGAPLGNDVPSGSTVDDPDIRRRLLVDAAEAQIGDGARRGRDRRAAFFRIHARVRRAPVEAHLHRVRIRSAEDHVADRRRLVVDVADPRVQAGVVECGRPEQTDLFLRREQQLDARVPPVLGEDTARCLEHHGDGRLVDRAEDRPGGIADDPLVDHRLDRARRRHRVQVRAQEERRAFAVPVRLDAAVQVADRRADLRACVVLVDVEPEVPQVPRHGVRDRALLSRRAGQRGELREQVEDVRRDAAILRSARHSLRRPTRGPGRGRARRRRIRGRAARDASVAT